jgi:ubiquinone/menaquinone biosynthesis C-methylase UbiE
MAVSAFHRLLRATERGAAPGLRRWIWKGTYNLLSLSWGKTPWRFMNYGYMPPGEPFPLEAADEPERAFIGLYHQAVAGLPVEGAHVLEVGCGHGGGASYVARYFAPAGLTGVDLSRATVARARRMNAGVAGLAFQLGDAEALPFPDGSFDVVVNIESSHCYGRMDRFVAEVARVLRPGGWFTWADMRAPTMMDGTEAAFSNPALRLEEERDLTQGVLAALDSMDAEKEQALARHRLLRPVMREFAGMRGTALHGALSRGMVRYLARRYRRV